MKLAATLLVTVGAVAGEVGIDVLVKRQIPLLCNGASAGRVAAGSRAEDEPTAAATS